MRSNRFARFFVLPFIFFAAIAMSSYESELYPVGEKKIRICTLIDC